jgi:hypothetical protein
MSISIQTVLKGLCGLYKRIMSFSMFVFCKGEWGWVGGWGGDSGDGGGRERVYTPMCPIHT